MLSLVERLKTWWSSTDPKQRVVTLGGIGALLLLLVGSAMFLTRPHYVTLIDGLSEKEKSDAVAALESKGFHPNIDQPGAVLIAEADRSRAELELSRSNAVPGTHHWGDDDLTKAGPFTSPDVERETLKSIQEGKIASTLESMEGVAKASVLITLPKQSVFADNTVRPTASVTITEKVPGTLTRQDGRGIASYVSHTVEGLAMKDVVVLNSQFDRLWDGSGDDDLDGKPALDAKVSREWEAKVQSRLDAVLGPGNATVIAVANVDTSKRHEETHTETTSPKPYSVIATSETMKGKTGKPGGLSGSPTNTNDQALAAKNGGENGQDYGNSASKKDYPKNETNLTTDYGVGDLKGLTLSVLVNSDKVPDPTPVQDAINSMLGGRIQLDASGVPLPNQPFMAKVTSMKFDGSAAQAAKDAADKAASQQRMQQILSLLPIAAVLFIALLVAKQVGKISKAILPAAPEPVAEMAEAEFTDALPGEEGPDALPAPAMFADEEEARIELERFEGQVDVPLESLKQMAYERPEMVATLIKSMMLGERA